LVAAYTASAAHVAKGDTVHGLMNITPLDKPGDLAGMKLNFLQDKFKDITHIIIDEFSMLNLQLLDKINYRLK
jgi:hypothetical protein